MSIISCNDDDSLSQREFDYSVFNNREILYSELGKLSLNKNSSNEDDFQNSVDAINEALSTNIEITDFDLFQKEHIYADLDTYLYEGYISSKDYDIINDFISDLNLNSFEVSIRNLENKILNMNLNDSEFKKYNDFINSLLITDDYYKQKGINIFTNNNSGVSNKGGGAGCAVAIAANAVSTLGLGSCVVPGPNCALAVVGKGLSLLGIYYSC